MSFMLALSAPIPSFAEGDSIRIVYGFAPGSAGDSLARVLAKSMQGTLGQTVYVENKAGGAGALGVIAVKNARADGTELLLAPSGSMTLKPLVAPTIGYDTLKDFEPISVLATYETGIAVGPDVPVKTVPALVSAIKADSRAAAYGTPGAGGLGDLVGLEFGQKIGVPLTRVSYRGAAPAVLDLTGGHLPMVISTLSDLLPSHVAGKIRVVATAGEKRSDDLPDVPTLKESGYDVVGSGWFGLFAPAKTPSAQIDRIYRAALVALASPEIKAEMAKTGLKTTGSASPAAFRQMLQADAEHWAPIIKRSGLKID